jgi:hypothetical protein
MGVTDVHHHLGTPTLKIMTISSSSFSSASPARTVGCGSLINSAPEADATYVLPTWRRYIGTFCQHARPALAHAAGTDYVMIISGGYGIARADEPIGWYDKSCSLLTGRPVFSSRLSSAKPSAPGRRRSWHLLQPPPNTPGCCGARPGARPESCLASHHHRSHRRRHQRSTTTTWPGISRLLDPLVRQLPARHDGATPPMRQLVA